MSVIIVVEPHPLLRIGILQLLNSGLSGSTVIGVEHQGLTERSTEAGCELLILSTSSHEDTYKLVSAACHIYEPRKILLISEDDYSPDCLHACLPSVAGYVSKSATPEVLLAAIKLVLAGGSCFPMQSAKGALEKSSSISALQENNKPLRWAAENTTISSECEKLGLTPRQYEVLVLLARGHPLKTIGSLLNISVATAKAHTEMLYQRLNVHSRNAAVYTAISRGATLGWPSIQTARQFGAEHIDNSDKRVLSQENT